jgi:hypothetical protein
MSDIEKKIKDKLVEMAKDCVNSTIEEVLCRDSELASVYNTSNRDDLIQEVGNTDPLVHEVVRRRLGGDPEPWLTAEECLDYLSNEEFDTEDHIHMAETDGQITAIRQMMLEMGMNDERAELGAWLYN